MCRSNYLLQKEVLAAMVAASAADPDVVDYLLATLQATHLPPMPPTEHRPLVVKDLLALRHSQLHCLQAARPRAGAVRKH